MSKILRASRLFTIHYSLFTIHLVLSSFLLSCQGGGIASSSGDLVPLKYSELLTLTKSDGHTVAEIKNPWGKDTTDILQRYVIEKPLKKVVVYSSVHASLLNEIGSFDAIRGVCDANFMYLDKVHQGIKDGTIADCGESMTPNIEKIIDLAPDAILLSPFEKSGTYGKLGKIGIPLIECADYMENSPLGRAEWMRFYGMLFGCEDKADSLFAAVEKRYNDIAALARYIQSRPTVLTEKKTGDTWYIAGSESYVGRIISDAGGDYLFRDEKSAGAKPYNPEVVFDRAQNADCWLIKYSQATPLTLPELSKEWGANSAMKAFRTQNVWGCDLSTTMFYEETPFHPDLLLKDYVRIFHPDILKDYTTRYYKKVLTSN